MDFSTHTPNFSQMVPSSEIRSIVKECLLINFLCFSVESFETPKIFVLSLENLFLDLEKSIASTVQPGVSSLG